VFSLENFSNNITDSGAFVLPGHNDFGESQGHESSIVPDNRPLTMVT
jgi:hypothetical protein